MLKTRHTIKGYVAGIVAFIFCPCHLPVTLPLLIALTAGTAFSAWLAQNTLLVGAISTIVFVGGLALAMKWIGQAEVRTRHAASSPDYQTSTPVCLAPPSSPPHPRRSLSRGAFVPAGGRRGAQIQVQW